MASVGHLVIAGDDRLAELIDPVDHLLDRVMLTPRRREPFVDRAVGTGPLSVLDHGGTSPLTVGRVCFGSTGPGASRRSSGTRMIMTVRAKAKASGVAANPIQSQCSRTGALAHRSPCIRDGL